MKMKFLFCVIVLTAITGFTQPLLAWGPPPHHHWRCGDDGRGVRLAADIVNLVGAAVNLVTPRTMVVAQPAVIAQSAVVTQPVVVAQPAPVVVAQPVVAAPVPLYYPCPGPYFRPRPYPGPWRPCPGPCRPCPGPGGCHGR